MIGLLSIYKMEDLKKNSCKRDKLRTKLSMKLIRFIFIEIIDFISVKYFMWLSDQSYVYVF